MTNVRAQAAGDSAVAPPREVAETSAFGETGAPHQQQVGDWIRRTLSDWVSVYRDLHAHPELSLQEERTAALVAGKLQAAGFTVHTQVGGHGVVGLLDNGNGPRVMLRGDMDALPVTEETGLPYASKSQGKGESGDEVGVMHACGHDVHVTNMLATAAFLAAHRSLWAGTLMVVAQPAEEIGEGAARMLDAGLFERFGKPDLAIALHVASGLAAGRVGYVPGWAFANVDSVDITLHGRSGHGARPHEAADPIVAAAHLVTALQTLVSRRVNPQAPAVVTVGVLKAGTKRSVIPDTAKLELTVRSYSDATRKQLLEGIAQLARDVCLAFECAKPPTLWVKERYTPALYNDPALSAHAAKVFRAALGDKNVVQLEAEMGGEDFGRYPRKLKVPGLMFRLGAVGTKAMRRSVRKGAPPLPGLHSSHFAPDPEPTLTTGVVATANLLLSLMPAPQASDLGSAAR